MITTQSFVSIAMIWSVALLVAYIVPHYGQRRRIPWPRLAILIWVLLSTATMVTGFILQNVRF